jgi:hypothetical protein
MNNALESVKKEIAILKKCNHKNVLKLYEVIENEIDDKMYLGTQIKPYRFVFYSIN